MSSESGAGSGSRSGAGSAPESSLDDMRAYAIPVGVTDHALEMFDERTPADSVSFETAWHRGEDIEHPAVLATRGASPTPIRARVYNHAGEYFAVFVVCRDRQYDGGEFIATVYNDTTHEHGPTRAYIREHGPHWSPPADADRDREGGDADRGARARDCVRGGSGGVRKHE